MSKENAKKLFVGNLSWKVSEQSLRQFFETIGAVVSAKVVTDQMTGKSKGFGFVEYENGDDAIEAVEKLNNQPLDGRNIRVSEAQERPRERSDRPYERRESRGDSRDRR